MPRSGKFAVMDAGVEKKKGYRRNTCNPFSMMMVRQEGLEPPTLGLEGRCSIQLSYCRIDRYIRMEPRSNRSGEIPYRLKF